MKSDSAWGTTFGRPSPRPAPVMPPLARPNSPALIWPQVLKFAFDIGSSQQVRRVRTCDIWVTANTAGGRNMTAPMTSHDSRSVATYSITTNRPKNIREVPRSVWNTSTAIAKRSEEHTSELQSRGHLVCRLLLEKKTYE